MVTQAWLWAVLSYAALVFYVLLDKASWRVRVPLLVAIATAAALTLPIGGPAEDFGWFSYGPLADVDLLMQRMAQRALSHMTWAGLAMLVCHAFLCAAVWTLPRRRSVTFAAVAGLMTAGGLTAAILVLSDADSYPPAVWIAGLVLLASLAIALVASQRASPARLAIAGAALLAYPSLDLLNNAVLNASLADRGDGLPVMGMAVMVAPDPGLSDGLLLAARPAGLLLVVLGCLLASPSSAVTSS
jgi:hypothetical protein